VTTGGLEPVFARRRGKRIANLQGATAVIGGATSIAPVEADQPAVARAAGQVATVCYDFGILLHQPFARGDRLLVAFSSLGVDDRMFGRPARSSELTIARVRKQKLWDRKNRYIPENRQSPARQACLTLISGADHAFPLPSASGRCPAGWLREFLSCPISKARFKLRQ
jgi:hypothetical protein